MRLAGKVAIVTGGGSGIGRGIVLALAREGADVAIPDIQVLNAEKVADEVKSLGRKSFGMKTDVTSSADVKGMVERTREVLGKVDILVNNAGMARRQLFLDATVEAWDEIIGVNLKGVYFLSQRAARLMVSQRSGKIVNISSVHDTNPMASNSIYCIAKSGMVMLTKSLALELAEHGIQVNCVSPGAIATDENKERLDDPAYRAKVLAKIPSGRIGTVDDVVGAVVLLASSEADYVTGATLYVDGGMLLH